MCRLLLACLCAAFLLTNLPARAYPICKVDSSIGQRLNLPVYEWSDNEGPCRGTIVAVHGLTFYAAAYDDLASHLATKGYRFFAADMRGFGRWRTENERFAGDQEIHFTWSKDDVIRILEALRQEDPGQKIYCMGESLGANMALWILGTRPELVDGAILSAPCYKTQIHPQARWAVDFFKGLSNPSKRMDLTPYITPYLSDSKTLTQNCLADQRICRDLSVVELIKAQKTNKNSINLVDKIPQEMPILILAGEKDAVYKTSELPVALNKFGTRALSVNVLPERGHLLLEHQQVNPQIGAIIDSWLDQLQTPEIARKPEQQPATSASLPHSGCKPALEETHEN